MVEEEEPNENPAEAGCGLGSADFGVEEDPKENPELGADELGAADEPKENPDVGAVDVGVLFSSDFGADDEPNEKPDVGAAALTSESGFEAGAEDEPNEKPDEGVVDTFVSSAFGTEDDGVGASLLLEEEPNEKDDAEGPLGDPLGCTAAPNANAVEGEVEGCLAPNENEKGSAGVEVVFFSSVTFGVASSFFSSGFDVGSAAFEPSLG